ncbi:MAG TPA: hypothetical protein VHO50_09790 [Bacteroidales bacterium]|nr:hypothetical protein [Bacteroidales bacterium]
MFIALLANIRHSIPVLKRASFPTIEEIEKKARRKQPALHEVDLLAQFKEAEKLPENEKTIVLKMVRSYIRDYKTQQGLYK